MIQHPASSRHPRDAQTAPQRQGAARQPAELRAALQRTWAEAARQRQARSIARRLTYAHGIPPFDAALVPWLTPTPCATNLAALTAWVAHATREAEAPATTDAIVFATLSARLCRLLADVTEIQPC